MPAFAPVGPSPFALADEFGWGHAMAHSPYVEWYQNSLALEGSPVQRHHRETYGDLPYDAFVKDFLRAVEGWDPAPWADLFAAAGARYVVLVTKHHDGVLLWPSEHPNPRRPNWQTRRDVVGELAGAVRSRGLRFGTYYSGGLDWTFGGLPMGDIGAMLAAVPQDEGYVALLDAHWRELIERYRPDVLWNDIGHPAGTDLVALRDTYYDAVPDGVVNDRFGWMAATDAARHSDFASPEYSTHFDGPGKWESTRGIGTSFGYNRSETDDDLLSSAELIHLLVDVVARGGNLLLNTGPAADGTIPWAQAERLLGLGWWLRTNGPAIHATRPWVRAEGTTAEGAAVRFTESSARCMPSCSAHRPALRSGWPRADRRLNGRAPTSGLAAHRHRSHRDPALVPPPSPAVTFRITPAPVPLGGTA
ncbi:MAG: alpha-L-fucosidase [Acidimicrobiales bacterium]